MALICFDAGHGGRDSGAVGPTRSLEKNHVLDIAIKAGEYAKKFGHKVIYTRRKDIFITLSNRAEIANNKKCDIFVSIHCNAATTSRANGTETFYFPGSKTGSYIATAVQQELVDELELRDRGIKTARFAVLRLTNMPSILVETAFISNYDEEQLLKDEAFRERAAIAIVRGINKYLGVSNGGSEGTSDEDVLEIQRKLNRLKIGDYRNDLLQEDGIEGPLTESSIRKFQYIMSLSIDGIWGTKTEAAYQEIINKPTLFKDNKYNRVTRYIQFRVQVNIDGIFGDKTESKVIYWQEQNDLIGDGIVGPNTWTKLIG